MPFPRSHRLEGAEAGLKPRSVRAKGGCPPPAWPLPARPSSSSPSSCLPEETARPPADIPFSLLPLSHTRGHELQAQAPGVQAVAPCASPGLSFLTRTTGVVPAPTRRTATPAAPARPGEGARPRQPPRPQSCLLLTGDWPSWGAEGAKAWRPLVRLGPPDCLPAG